MDCSFLNYVYPNKIKAYKPIGAILRYLCDIIINSMANTCRAYCNILKAMYIQALRPNGLNYALPRDLPANAITK